VSWRGAKREVRDEQAHPDSRMGLVVWGPETGEDVTDMRTRLRTAHSLVTTVAGLSLLALWLSGATPEPGAEMSGGAPGAAASAEAHHHAHGVAAGGWEGSAEGKAYSEFNHHLAGALVVLIGLTEVRSALALPVLAWSRFLLPAAMLAAGGFLLIWSDHEAWPIGSMSLVQTLTSGDTEILQHKLYAVLLLTVGTIELLRHLGRVRHGLWRAPLPVFAIVGGLLLFLHSHGAHPAAHKIAVHHAIMGTMAISAGACKLIPGWGGGRPAPGGPSSVGSRWDLAWAALICLIGVDLLLYSE